MDRLAAWLRAGLPPQQAATLVHNDYQIENILVDAADPATAVAVLDWDMCTRGDPLMDLGYLLNCWTDPDDDPAWRGLSPAPGCAPGLPTRRELVERYARSAGFDVEHAHWYHVFGVFKLAVVLEQIHVRFRRGQTRDARFATLGERVAGLAAKDWRWSKLRWGCAPNPAGLYMGLRPKPPASACGGPCAPRRSRRGAPCAPWAPAPRYGASERLQDDHHDRDEHRQDGDGRQGLPLLGTAEREARERGQHDPRRDLDEHPPREAEAADPQHAEAADERDSGGNARPDQGQGAGSRAGARPAPRT